MILKIGRQKIEVKNLKEAVEFHSVKREDHLSAGHRGSSFPQGEVTDGKKTVYTSFNGRVWPVPMKKWTLDTLPIEPTTSDSL